MSVSASDPGSDSGDSSEDILNGIPADALSGTPIRLIDWLLVPALYLLLGIAGVISSMLSQRGFEAWLTLGGSAIVVGVGFVYFWFGFAAYSRITVADTARFNNARTWCAATAASAFIVTGVVEAAYFWVFSGILLTALLSGRAVSKPSYFDWAADRRLLSDQLVFAVSSVLFCSALASGIIAFANTHISSARAGIYLGSGADYVIVAAIGGFISARSIVKAGRQ